MDERLIPAGIFIQKIKSINYGGLIICVAFFEYPD